MYLSADEYDALSPTERKAYDDECAEESRAECAAEAANERALYGPTEAMLADYEAEAWREAQAC